MGIQADRDTHYSYPSWAPEPYPYAANNKKKHKMTAEEEDAFWQEVYRKAKLTKLQKLKEFFKSL